MTCLGYDGNIVDLTRAPATERPHYFHLRDGEDILLDPDGREFGSLEEIRNVTLVEARAIIGSDIQQESIKLTYHIDVEDALGQIVHCLQFEDAVQIIRGRSAH